MRRHQNLKHGRQKQSRRSAGHCEASQFSAPLDNFDVPDETAFSVNKSVFDILAEKSIESFSGHSNDETEPDILPH